MGRFDGVLYRLVSSAGTRDGEIRWCPVQVGFFGWNEGWGDSMVSCTGWFLRLERGMGGFDGVLYRLVSSAGTRDGGIRWCPVQVGFFGWNEGWGDSMVSCTGWFLRLERGMGGFDGVLYRLVSSAGTRDGGIRWCPVQVGFFGWNEGWGDSMVSCTGWFLRLERGMGGFDGVLYRLVSSAGTRDGEIRWCPVQVGFFGWNEGWGDSMLSCTGWFLRLE
ncbi:uncharacterized protein LOC126960803 isoform X3 [Macaca thibetana thibetana]|uniref:uncharacterized protein LOC126960803 isoform X3 n=1 Tax=Macaca thibetana thibetana TaxID=257877 RepID=UPI0021BC4147|nr:uncharacterized protein LOC126960803 isoform X3 [Macaca thibetana thibetana]